MGVFASEKAYDMAAALQRGCAIASTDTGQGSTDRSENFSCESRR